MKCFSLIAIVSAVIMSASCNGDCQCGCCSDEEPVMLLRLRQTSSESDERWNDTFQAIKENPGCCDEVWFATGVFIPPLDLHREHAARLVKAKEQLEQLGLAVSLQVQMTIGHGDSLADGIEELFSYKTWGGWTGSTGVEAKYCNCPRQPEFLKYMQDMSAIYAPLNFRTLWIDDDLRYVNHSPATKGSHLGCWCETCIAAFNEQHKSDWTRETLSRAVASDKDIAELWWQFSTSSLVEVARVIAEEFVKASPDTQFGFQHTNFDRDVRYQDVIVKTLADISCKPVLFRPGAGDYYDTNNADGQITKSMQSVKHMNDMDETNISSWCPEIESWPRVYGSRTARGIQVEGFAAMAYGADAMSYFVMGGEKEDAYVYSYSLLRPLSEASEVIHGYKKASEGTKVAGYQADVNVKELYRFGRSGLPVLPGEGVSLGVLEQNDMKFSHTSETSKKIQQLRDRIDSLYHTPVLCTSPFIGLVIPRIDGSDNVRTIALINTRIDSQYKVRMRVDSDCSKALWFEMREEPVRLDVIREGEYCYVEVPEIQPWNCGYVELK